ncbi:MAG: hypothetical protein LPK20_03610 [Halomonas sp.]|jgi:hypothetical protein|uniref:Uncharacterized protein n=1 Tax=Billgrantia tianxiuensis TaxID=2497861 RepID=A0A6I6SSY6_9GAMM|nr:MULTISPECIES: hypothetical protein [Halomonas]MCE8035228.1 hypothetical protein [Halomonas sp. MCCC 1A11057]MDX5432648.1 hypothetical protein [Halomonas sp.]QHC51956.1 hypothetical protein EKK97_23345 [Halomonas tianxiuensis]
MKRLFLLLVAGLTGMSAGLGAAGENRMSMEAQHSHGGSANTIQVLFDGEPGTRFQASLTIEDADRSTTHELEETVPIERIYEGEALEASVRQTSREGALTVEVRKGGSVSRSSTSGQDSVVRLRVR